MGHLPEEEDGKKGPSFVTHLVTGRRPTHHGGDGPGNGPHHRAKGGDPFKGRIKNDVAHQSHKPQEGR